MKTNPLVSVITPAYNVEHVLEETIKSVLNQTYNNFEFIILDDASPDNTWQIIQKWAKKDKRIIPVKNEINLYIAENRNKGLLLAKGKYIVWQDADDISVSSRIEKQVEFMEQNPDVAICGGYLQSFN
ncbi:glycosyltransferase family 2 protein, partial [candidate division WWE3 bacterium]|nr:glycosyltransferase family 2 protein [candidate division WWE3 bacterium]